VCYWLQCAKNRNATALSRYDCELACYLYDSCERAVAEYIPNLEFLLSIGPQGEGIILQGVGSWRESCRLNQAIKDLIGCLKFDPAVEGAKNINNGVYSAGFC
jgi:hypothetical protein